MTKPRVWKVLGDDGLPHHGGKGQWQLPNGEGPAPWMPKLDDVVPCRRGYHLCRRDDLVHWLGPVIYEADYDARSEVIDHGNKLVVARARLLRRLDTWNARTARLFAADCAEHVLPIFEQRHPDDDRPRKAIKAARLYAEGEIDAAARDAARAVAWDADGAAAWDAAWDAARNAAWDAARAAAGAAERQFQTDLLFGYLYPEEK